MQAALGLGGEVTVELVARQPDVLTHASNGSVEVPWSEVEPVVAQAGQDCRAMRAREGEALTAELRHRLDLLEQGAQQIAAPRARAAGAGARPAPRRSGPAA